MSGSLDHHDERDRLDDRTGDSLAGRTCLVTGGSRGIGRAIALECASHGADVAVNYRHSVTAAESVGDRIENMDESAAAVVRGDVSDPESVERMVEGVRDELGPVDVLVNNAGITADSRFERMTLEEWQQVIDVNLTGVFLTTRAVFEDVAEAENGRIITISSVVGQRGNLGQANYAAAKSGLFGFTRALALELADTDATANCVAPGFTETDMLSTVPDRVREKILRRVPAGRFAEPDEIAAVVRFLASAESSYLTGQVIGVDGGMSR